MCNQIALAYLVCTHLWCIIVKTFVKPLVNYPVNYMVAKLSHILVHIFLGRLGLMGKVLILWSNGEEHHLLPPYVQKVLKVLQVFKLFHYESLV